MPVEQTFYRNRKCLVVPQNASPTIRSEGKQFVSKYFREGQAHLQLFIIQADGFKKGHFLFGTCGASFISSED